jgi:aspartyl-tRNA synthetase
LLLEILNASKVPPFTIEDNTDGGDDLEHEISVPGFTQKSVRENLMLRHKVAQQTRIYLDSLNFIEVETPVLIKSYTRRCPRFCGSFAHEPW